MKIKETQNAGLIAELNRFVHEFHVNHYPDDFQPYDYHGIRAFFEKVVGKEGHTLLVAGEEAAFGYVWFEHRTQEANVFKKASSCLYVHQISVRPDERGNGTGSRLMEEVERHARGLGVDEIQLDYWVANELAKKFYEKMGFVPFREYARKNIM